MLTLFSWYISTHESGFAAHGIVSGHPKLPDGTHVHTSVIVSISKEKGGILVRTRSGSLYHLRPEDLGSMADLPDPEVLGLPSEFWQYCAHAREQADRGREAALSALHASGLLCLRVAGSTVLSALWSERNGLVQRVEPIVHLGMFQDSVLIWHPSEDGSDNWRLDFRYFPYPNQIEPYGVSENIETILIINEGAHDVTFGYDENKRSCTAGAATEINATPWRQNTS